MGVRKMKKARIPFLLLAGVLLLAGCQKEGRIGGNDAINFSAVSNPGTKTVYGGEYAYGNAPVSDSCHRAHPEQDRDFNEL